MITDVSYQTFNLFYILGHLLAGAYPEARE